ncbi:cobalamin biosynthesis protein CobD [Archaeoglobales archaeon]|nr:MAG: cobalamin biosynthesis protein CobD [Archaeoglobales archaeon]RLI78216.1 MAG: cobalamin biosynthesis protein CobD [Archaeoglobales archaeon]
MPIFSIFNLNELLLILFGALILDLLFAEPPEVAHPSVWFGRVVGFFDSKWEGKMNFVVGSVATLVTILFSFLLVWLVTLLDYPFNLLWATYLLYSSVSIKSMVVHAKMTYKGGVVDAKEVQMIVSRNTAQLNEHQLISAVIESIAENFVDGVLAPLFYFSLFGVSGAVVYRAINVCDAMIGYRDGKYEYFGKIAARLDDLANFIPARLSVLLFSVFNIRAMKYALKYKIKLNGHPIAAMAGLLDVKIEKPGKYLIEGKEGKIEDIERCIKYYWMLCGLTILLTLFLIAFSVSISVSG